VIKLTGAGLFIAGAHLIIPVRRSLYCGAGLFISIRRSVYFPRPIALASGQPLYWTGAASIRQGANGARPRTM
jgi:hypothetical protein